MGPSRLLVLEVSYRHIPHVDVAESKRERARCCLTQSMRPALLVFHWMALEALEALEAYWSFYGHSMAILLVIPLVTYRQTVTQSRSVNWLADQWCCAASAGCRMNP